jgi:hypothetical protein
MIESLTAVILRVFGTGRLCIFTRTLGKIFCAAKKTTHQSQLIAGSILTINIAQKRPDTFTIEYIDNTIYPDIRTTQDLSWLHHVLELYYFYLPEHQVSVRDFDYLIHYLALIKLNHESISSINLQNLAISHFLSQTGFHEQPALHRYAKIFEEFIDPSVSSGVPSSLTSIEKVSIQNLILRCLQEHPQFHKFKTIPFLYGAHTP